MLPTQPDLPARLRRAPPSTQSSLLYQQWHNQRTHRCPPRLPATQRFCRPQRHQSRSHGEAFSWRFGYWAVSSERFGYVRLQLQLSHLRKNCRPIPDLQRLATQIQNRLNVRREIDVKISEAVSSPFVCGLLKPAIILPQTLAQNLSPDEMSALLSHEIAHLRQHDLFWCVAWRWMKAVCWFHPLVWNIPAAHNLACEQEADRVAAGQLAEQDSYSRMLARLALRVLALPAVETKLTLNGSSQIARRLKHLGKNGIGAWNWKYSVAGFGLAGLLFPDLPLGASFQNPLQPFQEFRQQLNSKKCWL